ncbi:amino acid adenylation domain-containing protein [Micromonospora sp. NPDC018662]|uniref:amino acid adenylation domain-containing protein n=1 Tax=Micromonospora sp. NPDC018662 TaxID=3364238 RepID=UPI0037A0FE00
MTRIPTTTLTVPQLGEGIVEVRILCLLKQPGDTVAKDELLYEMEHDKAALEIESPVAGRLVAWLVEEGQTVPIGGAVAELQPSGAAGDPAGDDSSDDPVGTTDPGPDADRPASTRSAPDAATDRPDAVGAGADVRIPPRTRAYARRLGLDDTVLASIPVAGSTLLPADVDRYVTGARRAVEPSADAATGDREAPARTGAAAFTDVSVSDRQRRLNHALRAGSGDVVPAVVATEVAADLVDRAVRHRPGSDGFSTAFQLFARLAARVAADFPRLRARRLGGDRLRVYDRVNLGIACSTEDDDLTIGVVREADQLDDAEFDRCYVEAVERALAGQSQADGEVTLMVSHLGDEATTFAVPVVVSPAVATLFLGAPDLTRPEPVRRMVLAFDHTVLNGREAARFLDGLRDALSAADPAPGTGAPPPARPRPHGVAAELPRLAEIAMSIVGHPVDPDRPLGEQGFHSAAALRLAREVGDEFGVAVPATAVWRHPTLTAMLSLLPASTRTDEVTPTARPAAPTGDTTADDALAIIGMSCRFPGADDPETYWALLRDAGCRITGAPSGRFPTGVPDGFRGGFLDRIDRFDADFFGITPRQAISMDPQQRILLELSWQALESAALNPDELASTPVGVYAAACSYDYREQLVTRDVADGYATVGTFPAFLANRISHFYDFTGPSITVDTACSGALTALALAESAIRAGDCEVALVGAVNLLSNGFNNSAFHRAGMLSPQGGSRVFDQAADGFVRGEGAGWVVLTPLHRAVAAGTPVLAVLRGTAVNHGGRAAALTAPNPVAQTGLVRTALDRAGIRVADLGFVEAHGTGTPLGDPIELNALREVLTTEPDGAPDRAAGPQDRLWIGSAKANIGHLEAAAGMAGLIKTVQVLRHGRIPATPGFTDLNPHIDLAGTPLTVADRTVDWRRAPGSPPRRAAVSAFGFGGSNAHAVLEEAPVPDPGPAGVGAGPVIVPLSAATPEALARLATGLADVVERDRPDLAQVGWSLQHGRRHLPHRMLIVSRTTTELVAAARSVAADRPDAAVATAERPAALDRLSDPAEREPLREWLRGGVVDWGARWPGVPPRRIPLAPYPFRGEAFWLPAPPRPDAAAGPDPAAADEVALPARHPLTEHRVGGRTTAAGALLLDAMAGGGAMALRDIRLPNRVPIDGPLRLDRHVADVDGTVTVTHDGRVCARGAVDPEPPAVLPVDPLDRDAGRPVDLALVLARNGVEVGPAYRVVTGARRTGTTASATIGAPAGDARTRRVGWLDAALQTSCVLLDADGPHVAAIVGRLSWSGAVPDTADLVLRRTESAGEGLTVDLDAVDDRGRHVLRVRGLRLLPLPEGPPAGADAPVCLFSPRWVAPSPAAPPAHPPRPTVVLYDPYTAALAAPFVDAGNGVLVGPGGLDRRRLADAVANAGHRPVSVLLLVGGARWAEDRSGASSLRRWLAALLTVAQTLHRAAVPAELRVVTTGLTAPPAGAPSPGAALQGALLGALRSVPRETPAVTVAAVDLPDDATVDGPIGPETAGDALAAAASEPCGVAAPLVALRDGRRYRQVFTESGPADDTPGFRTGGVYVLFGGAAGIGAEVARHLAVRYRAALLLVGRSAEDDPIRGFLEELRTAGARARYASADVADEDAVRAVLAECRAAFGEPDGVLHSVGSVSDAPLHELTEADLDRLLDTKVNALLHLRDALRGRSGALLVLFSSVAGLFGSVGGLNYAAANAFLGHYAAATDGNDGLVVRAFDWGLWRDTGLARRYAPHVRRQYPGLTDFAPAQGLRALEAGVSGGAPHVVAVSGDPEPLRPFTRTVPDGDAAYDLDRYARAALARRLVELGVDPAGADPSAAAATLGVAPGHRPLLAALLDLPADDRRTVRDPDQVTGLRAHLLTAYPDLRGHVELLDRALAAYGPVLRGETPATGVLFPGGAVDAVEAVYRGNRLFDPANGAAAEAVAEAAVQIRAATGRPPRILEIGAGVGGTTAAVLDAIERHGRPDVEYTYTDISQAFLHHARRRFADRVQPRLLNIEQRPQAQGFTPHHYDLVVASNVLHATRDLAETLAHVAELLVPAGRLFLVEMVAPAAVYTITFGLTDGWWRHIDAERRLPRGPLLDVPRWRALLTEHGWELAATTGERDAPGCVALLDCRSPADDRRQPPQPAETPDGVAVAADPADLLPELTALVADLTGQRPEQLDPDTDFPALGVDSLLTVEFTAILRTRFPAREVPSTVLFECPTPRRLARWLAETQPRRSAEPAAVDQPRPTLPAATAGPSATAAPAAATARPTGPSAGSPRPVDGDPGARPAIAVIGLAGRYPGARDVDAFWRLLSAGTTPVSEVPADRWDWRAARTLGGGYARWGCFLDDWDRFDPALFRITPRDAALMDPQERLFLEIAWQALETAGYAGWIPGRAGTGPRVGVFAGVTANSHLIAQHDAWLAGADNPEYAVTAAASVANRVSHALDLSGPSMTVDTMCSSSLTALHLACRAVQDGEADLALAGGVNLYLHPDRFAGLCALRMPSRGDRTRAFGAGADGFVPGEGVGAVVLKRLDAAQADGDSVYAVIRGTGLNHGGGAGGYTVPNPLAQAALIDATLRGAGVDPDTVDYVEAHGTGTELGDPIELRALAGAFRRRRPREALRVGSVKSNIGHAEAAAGIAGLTKAILQLRHGQLVPTLHAERPNPRLDTDGVPVRIQHRGERWVRPTDDRGVPVPRRIAVSSFGAGGANAHVVLEEHQPTDARPHRPPATPVLVPISAPDPQRLRAAARHLSDALTPEPGVEALLRHPVSLVDLAYTLGVGRRAWPHRAAIRTDDHHRLREALDALADGRDHPALVTAADLTRAEPADRDWVRDGRLTEVVPPGRRVPLPTTVLDRRRMVLPGPGPAELAERPTRLPLADTVRVPLAQAVSVRLDGTSHWLAHHVVDGNPLLPAAFHPELVYEALLTAGTSPYRTVLRDLVWPTPAPARPMTVRAELGEPDRRGNQRFAVSAGADDLLAQGRAEPVTADWRRPALRYQPDDLDSRLARDGLAADEFYRRYRANGYEYGPSYRTVGRVWSRDGETVAELRLPDGEDPDRRHVLHPALLDGACQAAAFPLLAAGPENASHLPMAITALTVRAPVTGAAYVHARPVTGGSPAGVHVFDLRLVDVDSGEVIAEVEGFRVRTRERHSGPPTVGDAVAPRPVTAGAQPTGRPPAAALRPTGGIGADRRPAVAGYRLDWSDLPALGAVDGRPLWVVGSGSAASGCAYAAAATLSPVDVTDGDTVDRTARRTGTPGAILVDLTGPGDGVDFAAEPTPGERLDEAWSGLRDGVLRRVFGLLGSLARGRALDRTVVLLVTSADGEPGPVLRGLHGLLRAAAGESGRWRPRLVTVEAAWARADPRAVVRALLAEAGSADADGDGWVRLGPSGRRRGPVLVPEPSLPGEPAELIRPAGSYLVVGGLGGLGRQVATALWASRPTAELLLVGRSEPDPVALDALRERAGDGSVRYHRCDVADPRQLAGLADALNRAGTRLRGIVYAAGVLRDGFLRGKTMETVDEVCRAKVLGAVAVDAAFAGHPLDFFVLSSSLAALVGNQGQSDYAFANGFLDGFAAVRAGWVARGLRRGRTLAVGLPVLDGAGMVAEPAAARYLEETYGLRPLPVAAAVDEMWPRLAAATGVDSAYVALVAGDQDRWSTAIAVATPTAVEPALAVASGPPTAAPTGAAATPDRRAATARWLAEQLERATGIPAAAIDPDRPLAEYGVDSLAVVRWSRLLEEQVGRVPLAMVLDSETSGELADRLLGDRESRIAVVVTPDGSPPAPTPADPVDPAGSAATATDAPTEFPLPERLVGLWTADQMAAPSAPYNISLAWELPTSVDPDALRGAVVDLVGRHPVLACRVRPRGDDLCFVPTGTTPTVPERRPAAGTDLDDAIRAEADRRFGLSTEPLLRAVLWADGPRRVLQLTTHHVAVDGRSAELIQQDLGALYAARLGAGEPLPPAVPFAVALRREREETARTRVADHGFWAGRLTGLGAGTVFAAGDEPAGRAGEHREYRLPPEFTRLVSGTGRTAGVTAFTVFLAAFAAALSRATGERSLLVAVPTYGRAGEAEETTVGCFVNSVPLRIDLDPAQPVARWLASVQEEVRGAVSHAGLAYPRLAELCRAAGGERAVPTVSFAFQNWARPAAAQDAPFGPLVYRRGQRGHFDLGLEVTSTPAGVDVLANHRSAVLDGAAVDDLVEETRRMVVELARALADDTTVGAVVSREAGTLVRRFTDAVRRSPDRTAVEDPHETLTYARLHTLSDQVARWVSARVAPGEPVAVLMHRSARLTAVLLGILKSGCPYVPLDDSYPPERLALVVGDAGCGIAVADRELAGLLPPRLTVLDAAEVVTESAAAPAVGARPAPAARDLAYLMFTSGSTGRPKGVAVTHGNVVHTLDAIAATTGVGTDDRLLAVTTVCFDISVLELFMPLATGGTVVVAGRDDVRDARRLSRLIDERGITVMQATPAGWQLLLDGGWSGAAGLTVLCGGEALPPKLARELVGRGDRVWNVYGPTEATIWSTIARVDPAEPVHLGSPVGATDLVVTEVDGAAPVTDGEPGELWIGGPAVARGYWRRPDLTAERFTPHPCRPEAGGRYFRTGDLVRRDDQGRLLFLGRADGQVKIRGHRLELGEVEAVLESHPDVCRAVATVRGEGAAARLVVIAEPARGSAPPDLDALRAVAGRKLPSWMLPDRLVTVAALPLTANGKVDRQSAVRLAEASPVPARDSGATGPGPTDPDAVRRCVSAAWADLLELGPDEVPTNCRFFDAGGNSLLLGRLYARLDAHYPGTRLEMTDLFANPTLDDQVGLLVGRIGPAAGDTPAGDPPSAAPTPARPSRREARRALRTGGH